MDPRFSGAQIRKPKFHKRRRTREEVCSVFGHVYDEFSLSLFIGETIRPKGHKIITFFFWWIGRPFVRSFVRVDHFFLSVLLLLLECMGIDGDRTSRILCIGRLAACAKRDQYIETIDRAAAKRWRFVLSLSTFSYSFTQNRSIGC